MSIRARSLQIWLTKIFCMLMNLRNCERNGPSRLPQRTHSQLFLRSCQRKKIKKQTRATQTKVLPLCAGLWRKRVIPKVIHGLIKVCSKAGLILMPWLKVRRGFVLFLVRSRHWLPIIRLNCVIQVIGLNSFQQTICLALPSEVVLPIQKKAWLLTGVSRLVLVWT